jgi:succinylarginine dihydrolase
MLEHQFDGLVGPTHHYAGLSPGNLASQAHAGEASNPRAAALEGLAKMKHVSGLGVPQAVLPPQPRPSVKLLRRLGFGAHGHDQSVLERALREAPDLLHAASSASSMWAANAATVVPACDARDGKTHLVVANLVSLLHRSIEAESTALALRRIFAADRFVVHEPLPATDALADEGAANHSRLFTRGGAAHLLGWGRKHGEPVATRKYPARQTYAASAALARATQLDPERVVLWQQDPRGIDGGAFHSDVLAVANAGLLLLHERAFVDQEALLLRLRALLGSELRAIVASDAELPLTDAVAAYPFNSQLLGLPSGKMRIVAPHESQNNAAARRFLERVVAEAPEIEGIDYLDVNGSMRNGGGPACLRLRVPLEQEERSALGGSVLFDARLERELTSIIERRYRDRLRLEDMADPSLLVEARTALDEITQALELGSLYDFQR